MGEFPAINPLLRPRRTAHRTRRRTLTYYPTAIGAFVVAFGLAFIPVLGAIGVLLFLIAGVLLVLSRPGYTLGALRREWLIVLVTLWCVMSFAWSEYTMLTLRYGIQLALTVMIAVVIGYRVAPLTFLKIIFIVSSLTGIISLLTGRARSDGLGFLGIYGSKNALADASALIILAALAILIDRRLSARWRMFALISLIMGAMLLIMGQSSGALVSVIGAMMIFGIIVLLQRLTPYARLVAVSLTIVLSASVAVGLSSFSDELAALFLDTTGKDITLTGRTDLWKIAFGQIAERPFLGVGFQAFWVHGQPIAEELWAQFGIANRSGFHFHNTMISNAVEIGILATALQTLIIFGTLGSCLALAVRNPSGPSIFFALYMVRLFMLMWIEVVYFYQFGIGTLIIIYIICYSHNVARRKIQ